MECEPLWEAVPLWEWVLFGVRALPGEVLHPRLGKALAQLKRFSLEPRYKGGSREARRLAEAVLGLVDRLLTPAHADVFPPDPYLLLPPVAWRWVAWWTRLPGDLPGGALPNPSLSLQAWYAFLGGAGQGGTGWRYPVADPEMGRLFFSRATQVPFLHTEVKMEATGQALLYLGTPVARLQGAGGNPWDVEVELQGEGRRFCLALKLLGKPRCSLGMRRWMPLWFAWADRVWERERKAVGLFPPRPPDPDLLSELLRQTLFSQVHPTGLEEHWRDLKGRGSMESKGGRHHQTFGILLPRPLVNNLIELLQDDGADARAKEKLRRALWAIAIMNLGQAIEMTSEVRLSRWDTVTGLMEEIAEQLEEGELRLGCKQRETERFVRLFAQLLPSGAGDLPQEPSQALLGGGSYEKELARVLRAAKDLFPPNFRFRDFLRRNPQPGEGWGKGKGGGADLSVIVQQGMGLALILLVGGPYTLALALRNEIIDEDYECDGRLPYICLSVLVFPPVEIHRLPTLWGEGDREPADWAISVQAVYAWVRGDSPGVLGCREEEGTRGREVDSAEGFALGHLLNHRAILQRKDGPRGRLVVKPCGKKNSKICLMVRDPSDPYESTIALFAPSSRLAQTPIHPDITIKRVVLGGICFKRGKSQKGLLDFLDERFCGFLQEHEEMLQEYGGALPLWGSLGDVFWETVRKSLEEFWGITSFGPA